MSSPSTSWQELEGNSSLQGEQEKVISHTTIDIEDINIDNGIEDEFDIDTIKDTEIVSVVAFLSPIHEYLSPNTGFKLLTVFESDLSFRRAWRGEIVWTNFHCLLCLGLTGFFLFWTAILLRYSLQAADIQSGQKTFKNSPYILC